ncbi:hypothetical protein A1O7_04362 [Cladophialophora yegresii CBS 114405]|uniref:HAUS augmin-like complex subunit 1 n=1 Tax=Cladophialophora yegresii CBS 114405 TaxID=1182544 RepID=W9W5D5_9EURO|nr:uncharacterized protein A1O7_04362 [Cladophialophora yegresii CBS 114405]EXJ60210.1 hypothetical protein A1O7_04362 [Cladophialophora yegresii CBS 114405]
MEASPSKARAQAVESHSWSIVLSWLSNLCHPSPVPAFERNATTLKAFQSLMAENIAADRLQELLFDAKFEELAISERDRMQRASGQGQEATGDNASSLLSSLENSLSDAGKDSLKSLARSAGLLGCCPPSSLSSPSQSASIIDSLPARIVDLSRQTFRLEDHISSIETLISTLQTQTTTTLHRVSTIRERAAQLSNPEDTAGSRPSTPPHASGIGIGIGSATTTADYSHLHAQTLQHQRETKQLQLKSAEYKARIAVLDSQLATVGERARQSTAALVAKQQVLDDKRAQITALERRFREFRGLPPDVDASRGEVNRLQAELEALKRRRDELFERI